MHELIASPFLDDYLVLRPGSVRGLKIPHGRYLELRQAATGAEPCPPWLADAVRRHWELDVAGRTVADLVLVRERSPYGYGRASYELNLGCNYDCEHCYLGLKRFKGLPWPERQRLLHILRDAGVLWLQLTGGEPLIDKLFAEVYELAFELGMMVSISSNGSRLSNARILDLLTTRRPYRLTLSVYGATPDGYDRLARRRAPASRPGRARTRSLHCWPETRHRLRIARGTSMQRIDWVELPPGLRLAVESRTGPVLTATTAAEGKNSEVAAFLRTVGGHVFIKGLRSDHPRVWTQEREAMVNPYIRHVGPRLLWHVDTEGWNVLGFEHVAGRHADYSPRSPDLPLVVHAMQRLGATSCPELPLKRAEERWACYLDDGAALELLRGDTLLHTDYNPMNVLVAGDTARIVDWAWPTRGAAWIDPACLVLRLMAAGHRPLEAEVWAAQVPAWAQAPREAIDTFALISLRMWDEIATDDPQPWKRQMQAMVQEWAAFRHLRN